MSFHELVLSPFAEFAFMRRALVACLALALGCGPIGLFLVMRRMSLMGDAMSHAVLPGAAVGFILAGLSLPAMSVGGFAAGVLVVLSVDGVNAITGQTASPSQSGYVLLNYGVTRGLSYNWRTDKWDAGRHSGSVILGYDWQLDARSAIQTKYERYLIHGSAADSYQGWNMTVQFNRSL